MGKQPPRLSSRKKAAMATLNIAIEWDVEDKLTTLGLEPKDKSMKELSV